MKHGASASPENRQIPEFLLRGRDERARPPAKTRRSKSLVALAVMVSLVIAYMITPHIQPSEARPAAFEQSMAAMTEEALVESRDEHVWWLKGAVDIPFPPAIANPFVPITVTGAKPDLPAPKLSTLKKIRQALVKTPLQINPCGTMKRCAEILAENPAAAGVLQSCRGVLNGRGDGRKCDALFASIAIPFNEPGFTDEQRVQAATVCHGMPNCARVISAHPSKAPLIATCRAALNGVPAAARECDENVMARVPRA